MSSCITIRSYIVKGRLWRSGGFCLISSGTRERGTRGDIEEVLKGERRLQLEQSDYAIMEASVEHREGLEGDLSNATGSGDTKSLEGNKRGRSVKKVITSCSVSDSIPEAPDLCYPPLHQIASGRQIVPFNNSVIININSRRNASVTHSCVALNETAPFRPASSLGAEWMDKHTRWFYIWFLFFTVLQLYLVFVAPKTTETDVYIAYLPRLPLCAITLGLVLAGYDLNIMKEVAVQFNFIYPMTCFVGYQAMTCYEFYVLHPTMILPLLCAKIPEAIMLIIFYGFGMLIDAAVFASTRVKRIGLMGYIVTCILLTVSSHIDSMDELNAVNKPENQICYSFIYSGCTSAMNIESGMMKIVTIFYMKMLYHNMRHPSSFMVITRSIEYSVTTSTGRAEGTAGNDHAA